jgi:hypothetical protein
MRLTRLARAGWHLSQPEPGLLTWTLPSGRRYTTAPNRTRPNSSGDDG